MTATAALTILAAIFIAVLGDHIARRHAARAPWSPT